MKDASPPSAWRKRLFTFTALGALLLLTGGRSFAASGDTTDQALAAAKSWIAQIDAGQYAESYDAGCNDFHHELTQERWVLVLKAFRPSFGPVVTRREVSHEYKQDGFQGMDGQFMIITYDTSFSRVQDGFEKVLLKLDGGKWRGRAYAAGPKPSSGQQAGGEPPQVNTQVNTIQTTHPPQ